MDASSDRPPVYRFGSFEVDPLARELRRQGVRVRLQEQPFQVLLALLQRTGQVVTREELRQKLWPSSVFVDFDHGLHNAIARLREALGDAADAPRFIETIPRVGYRFMVSASEISGPAQTPARLVPPAPEPDPVAPTLRQWARTRWLLLAAGATAALVAAVVLRTRITATVAEGSNVAGIASPAPAPTLAVLPFVNLSPDKEDEYFAYGITEKLIDKLAGIRALKVTPSTASFEFKGRQEPVAAVAKTLQVSHLLEGSVNRDGDRLSIRARLLDARQDQPLWSQTFERSFGDIFQIQDDIAAAVAAALNLTPMHPPASQWQTRITADPEAYRLYTIANAHYHGITVTRDLPLARRLFGEAIARDPNFADARAGLAQVYFADAWSAGEDVEASLRLGMAEAERAILLGPDSPEALKARGMFRYMRYRYTGDYAGYIAAREDFRRSVEIDPLNRNALFEFGRAMYWHDPELATSVFEQAMKADPLAPGARNMRMQGIANRGRLDEARALCPDRAERTRFSFDCQVPLAMSEALYGRYADTLRRMREALGSRWEAGPAGMERLHLWAIHMSLGDRAAAERLARSQSTPLQQALFEAAALCAQGRFEQAFARLDSLRASFPQSRLLDLPAAKLALIAGKPKQARAILEQRLPDLVRGIEPITAGVVIPAIDLAMAQIQTGARTEGLALLQRIAVFLDGPTAPRLPMFTLQRARVHVLAGERDAALRALERAYAEGLRTLWAIDLRPQPLFYIDPLEADPAWSTLRGEARYRQWLERIRADNARQLALIRGGPPAKSTG